MAELVGADGVVFEVCGKERGGEVGADVVEEGFLGARLDGVDAAEGEADEPVRLGVGDEGGGDVRRELDRLGGYGRAADGDGVGADDAGGAAAVAVGDAPGAVFEGGVGRGVVGGEGRVLFLLGGGEQGAEEPEVRGAGVEVEEEGLRADGYGGEEFLVVLFGGGGCVAGVVGGLGGGAG